LLNLFIQSRYDIFFIDWEKTRGKVLGSSGRAEEVAPISAWRTIGIAKHWCRLQTTQIVNLEFTIFIILMVLYGGSLVLLASEQPYFTLLIPTDKLNPILRFCVTAVTWMIAALCQVSLFIVY
jgi:meckelin